MLELRGREIRISHFNDGKQEVRVRSGATVKMTGNDPLAPSEPNHLRINCDFI
jgi:hypothetical protein